MKYASTLLNKRRRRRKPSADKGQSTEMVHGFFPTGVSVGGYSRSLHKGRGRDHRLYSEGNREKDAYGP